MFNAVSRRRYAPRKPEKERIKRNWEAAVRRNEQNEERAAFAKERTMKYVTERKRKRDMVMRSLYEARKP